MTERLLVPPIPRDVRAAFDGVPPDVRHRLFEVRGMIFSVAASDARVGAVTETLKWGEPAYLTAATGSGSTIRLGRSRRAPDFAAIHFICRTTLVATFRARFGEAFRYEGDRAVLVPLAGAVDRAQIEFMLAMALTYHLRPRGV